MYNSVSYFDLPVLMGKGFTFGITDEVVWGKAKDGTEWQAVLDGLFWRFAPYDPTTKSTVGNHEKMSNEQFRELFV